ncbi:MAG: DNA cytosine methyltransferase [Planctomycetes bacterium]|nr:DNA cytosine methyltransferase [Planctomycetota bacterium]
MNGIDLFAGAGGWSLGFEQASGCSPVVAVNHCEHAVHLHALNHPSTQHFLDGIKAEQIARIGNSVVPQVAAAIVRANAPAARMATA